MPPPLSHPSSPAPTLTYGEHGQLELILGPMFSGKSTELLRRIRRYIIAKRCCMVIKYKKDTRYDEDRLATHDQVLMNAMPCDELCDADALVRDMDVIGVDEGQFFPDLVEYAEKWAMEGKVVIVAALDGTFQRKPFGRVLELVPLAEHVTKLTSVCMLCYSDASFTLRLGNEKEVEVIGGADKYIAVCRSCFAQSEMDAAEETSLLSSSMSSKRVYAEPPPTALSLQKPSAIAM